METKKLWKQFIRRISLIITLFSLGMIIGLFFKNIQLLNKEIESRAKSHFRNIVLTRRWNANYHGVYVKKAEDVLSNPYLENPDVVTEDGTVLTLKNPALMTREISELAQLDSLYSFHITSLNPLNPNNSPNRFERLALESFEKGDRDAHEKINRDNRTYFRYMAPLKVEQSCLECHARQGYKLGDVRGGISVEIDITEVEKSLRLNSVLILVLSAISLLLLLFLTYTFVRQLMRSIEKSQEEMKKLAVTDELTTLYNRRYFFDKLSQEFSRSKRHQRSMACIMMDIDYFKKFNDTYGHQVGDLVLQSVARVLKTQARETDTVARYGGEEFTVLLPETHTEGAQIFAEKIRAAIEAEIVTTPDNQQLNVTMSLGVRAMKYEELMEINDAAILVKQADQALYNAKEQGRNQVQVFQR